MGKPKVTTYSANPTTFASILTKAIAGDVINLDPGNYGDGYVKKSGITINGNSSSFRSLNIQQSSNIVLNNINVDFTPNATTVTWSYAVQIQDSNKITFNGGRVIGGNAITGAAETATAQDSTGNVIGRPTARGFSMSGSTDIVLNGLECAKFYKGIYIWKCQRVTISKCNVHDMRTTAIVGSNVSAITVDGCNLHDANPWAWGMTPYGDHCDFLAFWSDSGQAVANDSITVTNNTFSQITGIAILGMWFQGIATAQFTNFKIANNTFLLANLQGIALWDSVAGSITGNTMKRTGSDIKQSPTVLLRTRVTGVTVTGNTVGAPVDDQSGGKNTISSNVVDNTLYGAVTTPTVDPRDAQIADLTSKLSAASASLATEQAKSLDLQSQVSSLTVSVTKLTSANVSLQATNDAQTLALADSASQIKILKDNLTSIGVLADQIKTKTL